MFSGLVIAAEPAAQLSALALLLSKAKFASESLDKPKQNEYSVLYGADTDI
jgi:hypothetical protein